jgi:hypothetical protein
VHHEHSYRRRHHVPSGVLAILLITVSGCGYMIGPGNDSRITTVEVPTFGNETFRRGIEQQLTESVQKEIQKRSFIRIVKGCDAETRLTGTIKRVRKRPVGRTAFADSRELELSLLVEVTWENVSTGEVISEYSVPLDQATTTLFTSSNFAPEVGQSLATAVHDNVQQAATQIVDMMDAPW